MGVHASICRACLALAAKKRLPAKAAASGLQAIIEISGAHRTAEHPGSFVLDIFCGLPVPVLFGDKVSVIFAPVQQGPCVPLT